MSYYDNAAVRAPETLTVEYVTACESMAGEAWPISGDATALARRVVQAPSVTEEQAAVLFAETHNIFEVVRGERDEVVFKSHSLEEALNKSDSLNDADYAVGYSPSTAVNYINNRGEVIRITAQYL